MKDAGATGNFEVLEFDNAECTGEGKQLYSKQETKKFPHADDATWESFTAALKI